MLQMFLLLIPCSSTNDMLTDAVPSFFSCSCWALFFDAVATGLRHVTGIGHCCCLCGCTAAPGTCSCAVHSGVHVHVAEILTPADKGDWLLPQLLKACAGHEFCGRCCCRALLLLAALWHPPFCCWCLRCLWVGSFDGYIAAAVREVAGAASR
jgi:hypothetical protein